MLGSIGEDPLTLGSGGETRGSGGSDAPDVRDVRDVRHRDVLLTLCGARLRGGRSVRRGEMLPARRPSCK